MLVVLPSRQDGSGVLQRGEFGDVQAFISQRAVEGLDEPVFHRLTRSNEIELHATLPRPLVDRARREFGTVVDDERLGDAATAERKPGLY